MTTPHADPHASHGAAPAQAHHGHPNYIAVFLILCLLTGASVVADLSGGVIGKVMVGLVVLTVASLKAMYVMVYFMHLKFEGPWKYALLAPTIVLALAIPAALAPDIAYKYYDAQTRQTKAYKQHLAAHGGDHSEKPKSEDHPAPSEKKDEASQDAVTPEKGPTAEEKKAE